ncbi:MAG: TRAP transporter small permease [Hyphomicrobium sp.]|nr:TRAP transporter small permease [Hyphomicrobium sp.]
MSETQNVQRSGIAPAAEAAVGRVVGGLAKLLAIVGGILLVALAVMSVVSIVGRAFSRLGLGPVPGDFELIEAGCAVAIFAFLPWCQFRQGHVTVDLLGSYLPPRPWAFLAVAGNIAMSIISAVVAWQLWLGFRDKLAYGETSMILQMPIWWGYAAGVVGAIVFVATCFCTVWRSLNEAIAGKTTASEAHL